MFDDDKHETERDEEEKRPAESEKFSSSETPALKVKSNRPAYF